MKIKRIICLVLCLIMSVFALASCEEDIISEAEKEKDRINYTPTVLEEVDLTLYIITEGDIANSTTGTVEDKIQQYLNDRTNKNFNTTLNIKFCKAADYEATIADKNDGIVLINSLAMLESMVASEKLADLNGYFTDEALIKKYGFATLNASFNKTNPHLLEVARDKVTVGEGESATVEDRLYFVPNNRVMGTYDYILINRNIVCELLNYNEDQLSAAINSEESFNSFKAELQGVIDANASKLPVTSADEVIKVVTGKMYEDRFSYAEDGYICNILSYPVITKAEVAESGFGVLSGTENVSAAMEIIYLFNSDVKMRNLLLYGVENIHFDIVDGVVVPEKTELVYKMALEYTGDVFKAYFCNDSTRDVWTEEIMNNGLKQNLESKSSVGATD